MHNLITAVYRNLKMSSEVRPGDVLRLFFGSTHKHYLVVKVGTDTIDLRHETGSETLLHENGKLISVGKLPVTGVVVLRDPNLYSDFVVGACVKVWLHEGKSFKASILVNEDGILKLKMTTGQVVFVDLESSNSIVRKVALCDSLEDVDAPMVDDLPELLSELQLALFEKKHGKRSVSRLRCCAPTVKTKCLPFWIVPILDNARFERKLLLTPEAHYAYQRSLTGNAFTVTGPCEKTRDPTTAVLFNSNGFKKDGLPVLIEKLDAGTAFPVDSLAALPALLPLSRLFLTGTALHRKIRYHTVLDLLFRGWRAQAKHAPKFDTLSDLFTAYPAVLPPSSSLYAALQELEPYNETALTAALLKRGTTLRIPTVQPYSPAAPSPKHLSRHYFGKNYGNFVLPALFTSEMLAQILYLDYGQRYAHAPAPSIQDLFRVRQGGAWQTERRWQALKREAVKINPYDRSHIAILNEMYDGLFDPIRAEVVASFLSHYAREAADADESPSWLYHLVTGNKLLPVSFDRLLRAFRQYGKSGYEAVYAELKKTSVQLEGWVVDPTTGAVYGSTDPEVDTATSPQDTEETPLPYTIAELTVLHLLDRLELRLNVCLLQHRAYILNRVQWKMRYDLPETGVALAGFVAHFGKKTAGEVAKALRELVINGAELRDFLPLTGKSDLSTSISRAEERAALHDRRKRESVPRASREDAQDPLVPFNDPKDLRLQNVLSLHPAPVASLIGVIKATAVKIEAPAKKEFRFSIPKEEMDRRLKQYAKWHELTAPLSSAETLDLVRNLCLVFPALLANNGKYFRTLGRQLPPGEQPKELSKWMDDYYSPLMELQEDASSQEAFVQYYRNKAAEFKAIHALALNAHKISDYESVRWCVVNAVHLFYHPDELATKAVLIPQNERFVDNYVKAVFSTTSPKPFQCGVRSFRRP